MTGKISEILVPVDGSENSLRAARLGVEMANALDVGLRLFFVFPAASRELIALTGMAGQDMEEAAQSAGQRVFDMVGTALGSETSDRMTQETACGDPAEEIIDCLDQRPGTLVVMGRRGLSPMKTLLLGSVSEKVTRHAGCAVTVVS